MNREDYKRVKQIFQSALDIVPDARARYLDDKCSDDPRFRHEVEKLLDSYKSDYLELKEQIRLKGFKYITQESSEDAITFIYTKDKAATASQGNQTGHK